MIFLIVSFLSRIDCERKRKRLEFLDTVHHALCDEARKKKKETHRKLSIFINRYNYNLILEEKTRDRNSIQTRSEHGKEGRGKGKKKGGKKKENEI